MAGSSITGPTIIRNKPRSKEVGHLDLFMVACSATAAATTATATGMAAIREVNSALKAPKPSHFVEEHYFATEAVRPSCFCDPY